jgi:hypothetical protein
MVLLVASMTRGSNDRKTKTVNRAVFIGSMRQTVAVAASAQGVSQTDHLIGSPTSTTCSSKS